MRITFIGSGNVATHMAAALKNAGHKIVQVYSPTFQHAALLAYHVQAEVVSDLENLSADTDMFIIAVKDDAIVNIARTLAPYNKIVLHTSGATGLADISLYVQQTAVLYPLQTFSKTRELDFGKVPLCIEASSEGVLQIIEQLAKSISSLVYQVNSDQRKLLHLAAVFACNFPNYLYSIANDILAKNELPFAIIRPLIAETAQKVQDNLPEQVQTGPAIRNDVLTMNAHCKLLAHRPDLQHIYEVLSQAIIKMDKIG